MPITITFNGQTRRLTHREEVRWEIARDVLHGAIVRFGREHPENRTERTRLNHLYRDLDPGNTEQVERCISEFGRHHAGAR